MLVLPLPRYREEGKKIAEAAGWRVVEAIYKVFPDGEIYLRIPDPGAVSEERVLVATTMFPGQNEAFLELLLAADALRKSGAREILALIPYLAYGRQDKVFLHGEPVSGRVVLGALKWAGYSKVIVADYHSTILAKEYSEMLVDVSVVDLLVEASAKHAPDPVVVLPDKGGYERFGPLLSRLGVEFDYLVKERDRVTGAVKILPKSVSVRGRSVVLVDDIISTGGTVAEASRMLLEQGAERIVVAATHGLLVGDALRKILSSGVSKIVLANTISHRVSDPAVEYVDVSERLAETVVKALS